MKRSRNMPRVDSEPSLFALNTRLGFWLITMDQTMLLMLPLKTLKIIVNLRLNLSLLVLLQLEIPLDLKLRQPFKNAKKLVSQLLWSLVILKKLQNQLQETLESLNLVMKAPDLWPDSHSNAYPKPNRLNIFNKLSILHLVLSSHEQILAQESPRETSLCSKSNCCYDRRWC